LSTSGCSEMDTRSSSVQFGSWSIRIKLDFFVGCFDFRELYLLDTISMVLKRYFRYGWAYSTARYPSLWRVCDERQHSVRFSSYSTTNRSLICTSSSYRKKPPTICVQFKNIRHRKTSLNFSSGFSIVMRIICMTVFTLET
jgi:hypothetical protein